MALFMIFIDMEVFNFIFCDKINNFGNSTV